MEDYLIEFFQLMGVWKTKEKQPQSGQSVVMSRLKQIVTWKCYCSVNLFKFTEMSPIVLIYCKFYIFHQVFACLSLLHKSSSLILEK
jgi:hypothetical protein